MRIRRLLHQDPFTGGIQGLGQQAQGVLRAHGDHDLVRCGGQPALPVTLGDGLAQLRQACHVEAVVAQVTRDLLGGLLVGGGQAGVGRGCGFGEIKWQVRAPGLGATLPAGQGNGAARSPHAHQVAVVAQLGVRCRDGGPADVQGLAQFALGRQPRSTAQPPVQQQHADPVGERTVGRARTPPFAQVAGQPAGGNKGSHRATLARLALIDKANTGNSGSISLSTHQYLIGSNR